MAEVDDRDVGWRVIGLRDRAADIVRGHHLEAGRGERGRETAADRDVVIDGEHAHGRRRRALRGFTRHLLHDIGRS